MMDGAAAAHVLVFPWPRQGHINPMLHLATSLVHAGLQVTFLHTDHNLRRLTQAALPPRLRLISVPDGLPDDHPRSFSELMDSMCTAASAAYRALLSSLLSAADAPVTCVVADAVMPFAIDIAQELGVPALAFTGHSACSYLAFLSMPKLVLLDQTPFPADAPVYGVPGMEGFLRRRDLPRGLCCCTEEHGDGDPMAMVLKIGEVMARSCRACALILNTAASMERPALAHIASRTGDVFAVGPLHAGSRSAASASLWREDDGCMAWLDGHEDRSVVYVSLGSVAVITHNQFTELLSGLASTGYAILWVLRPGMVEMTSSALLRRAVGAAAEAGKARFVEWAPQRDVLRHRAVGCFLTHAGWNSTLECAVEGVPMVCWPLFSDQQINSRFVGAVWRMGLDMKDVCDRRVVERTVREVMVSDEIRGVAQAMAQQLRLDVAEAGSSSSEMQRLVRFITELSSRSSCVTSPELIKASTRGRAGLMYQ